MPLTSMPTIKSLSVILDASLSTEAQEGIRKHELVSADSEGVNVGKLKLNPDKIREMLVRDRLSRRPAGNYLHRGREATGRTEEAREGGRAALEAALKGRRASGDYKSQTPRLWAATPPAGPAPERLSAPGELAAAAAAGGCAPAGLGPPPGRLQGLGRLSAALGWAGLGEAAVLGFLRERGGQGEEPPGALPAQGRSGQGGGGAAEAPSLPPEEKRGMPVSELKSLFQKGGAEEGPKGPGGHAPRGSPQKPCMLPVRCVPPPSAARGAEAPPCRGLEAPERPQGGPSAGLPPRSPYPTRRPLEQPGSGSPYLRRGQRSPKAGEEGAGEATVPLDAAEHEWLVKATDGQWSQRLHGLLLSDTHLAGKRDFMSGFTALHWAAKSGSCDMVSKVIEVAEKGEVRVNVNTKSYGGYTPLHIAAIHGQEEIIALLVKDHNAKVNLRDYSGKKPYQYLREGSSFAVRHLLRDPDLHAITGHNASIKKSAKVAASILSSTSTFLGVLSDDTAFYELTKGLKKPPSLNKFLHAATAPRRKLKSRGTFSSHSSLSESLEEDQEEATVKRRPVSECFLVTSVQLIGIS
uniref:LOW QUALITY PROTEIN: ankyrin repeat domain-containing protein SOWAHA n=1 Tax=Euleptes europaea TaxID=460621 RepID=UPI0025404260|nr:LOW QUALITY PROTEIN: ankyrin repeat domain-containing protein SOWAHA [Euleptes europaea]